MIPCTGAGMYTFIKLTVPPPSMVMFDASNRDQCEVRRLKTNTPLQALIMMNDPTVLEASRVLAEKISAEQIALRPIKINKGLPVDRLPQTNSRGIKNPAGLLQ